MWGPMQLSRLGCRDASDWDFHHTLVPVISTSLEHGRNPGKAALCSLWQVLYHVTWMKCQHVVTSTTDEREVWTRVQKVACSEQQNTLSAKKKRKKEKKADGERYRVRQCHL